MEVMVRSKKRLVPNCVAVMGATLAALICGVKCVSALHNDAVVTDQQAAVEGDGGGGEGPTLLHGVFYGDRGLHDGDLDDARRGANRCGL